ncbi:hypothetical protein [Dactylosporangium sp. CA-233914]|uniref:hypothetical protein n=1 Tax=Dactylosporangium sp. CA-233914 TaxID=3239934 RepID=UPI003D942914
MAEQYVSAFAIDPSALAAAAPGQEPTLHELGEATLPGRRWDQLAEALRSWGLPGVANLWGRPYSPPWFAKPVGEDPWPFLMHAPAADLAGLAEELDEFDEQRIYEEYADLPSGDDDVEEAIWLVGEKLPEWIMAARDQGRDLYIIRDGAK